MNELTYRALVWLTYRLAATFAVGVPLVLLMWSAWRREPMVLRLLGIYWKVASLMAISLLLLMDQRPLGYATAAVAPVLMVISLWFWVDINEELADQPSWRPLPLAVKEDYYQKWKKDFPDQAKKVKERLQNYTTIYP